MNKLEQFIKDHRDEFDSEEMKHGWGKIGDRFAQKTHRFSQKTVWWAAAAVFILILSGTVYFTTIHKDQTATAVQLPNKNPGDQVDPSYTSQINQFAQLIALKQDELKENQKSQPELYNRFLDDNNQLDSSYNYLRSSLASSPNKEILLEAMIKNLQLKIDMLNRQLQIIKQSNQKNNHEHKTI